MRIQFIICAVLPTVHAFTMCNFAGCTYIHSLRAILPIVCAPLMHNLADCVCAVSVRSCRSCAVRPERGFADYATHSICAISPIALDSLCATLPVASSCCLCAILRLHMRAQHAICQLRGCQRSATLPVAIYKFDYKSDYKSVCKPVTLQIRLQVRCS